MTYRKMRIALSLSFLLLFAGCAGAEDAPASDPFLAPAGIVLGMKIADAEAAALAAGFLKTGDCQFHGQNGLAERLSFKGGDATPCAIDAPVRKISYTRQRDDLLNADKVVADFSERIGAEAACRNLLPQNAQCAWNKPASYPLAHLIDTDVVGKIVKLDIFAVSDLARPNSVAGDYLKAFEPLAAIGEIDPLAPGGVAIGAAVEDVRKALLEAGFVASGYRDPATPTACAWEFVRTYEVEIKVQIRATFTKGGASRSACVDGAVVNKVEYQKTDYRPATFATAPAAEAVVSDWATHLGREKEAQACTKRPGVQDSVTVECDWRDFGGANGVKAAKTRLQSRPQKTTNAAHILLEGPQ